MQYYVMPSRDIRDNLATEQYLMNSPRVQLPMMLFYIERPCIIVGRNQNTLEEVNQSYCLDHDIKITRRLSGGGAMYQDLGNLCFSFIVPSDRARFGNFKQLVNPVLTALHEMGARQAVVTGRNDIEIEGYKFSGNAMYSRQGRTFSHGTLMYHVDTAVVAQALRVPKDKIASKGIKSVRARVTNIEPYLDKSFQGLTTGQFRDELIKKIWHVSQLSEIADQQYHLNSKDRSAIAKLRHRLYDNWDWVYGQSPDFTVKKRQHFTGGTIDARFLVQNGHIQSVKIYGDFFGTADVTEVEEALKGIPYHPTVIENTLVRLPLNSYFMGIPEQKIIDLLAYQH